jgi:hypothetical protein
MTKNNKAVKLARLEGCDREKIRMSFRTNATNWQDRVFAAVDGVIEGIGWEDGGGMYPNTFKIDKESRRRLAFGIGWKLKEIGQRPNLFIEALEDELRRFQLL